ncbi:unnamed protein product [Pseudo-nitzschia multistriata]|uniref:N-acetyltransferase domain-containing protein n=1 Tax=Pseudo-nitzschia multistriata TaxID=183589 RepID=A0A448Z346_9STRA|nr:unnamed protein product [Pseudo-nitzschia multistriata]
MRTAAQAGGTIRRRTRIATNDGGSDNNDGFGLPNPSRVRRQRTRNRRSNGALGFAGAIVVAIAIAGGWTLPGVPFSAAEALAVSGTGLPPAAALRSSGRSERGGHPREQAKEQQQPSPPLLGSCRQGFPGSRIHQNRLARTRLHLFFNQRDENGNLVQKPAKRAKPSSDLLDELRSPGISFPKPIRLTGSSSPKEPSAGTDSPSLVLRYMTTEDLRALVPMCINEFGSISQQPPPEDTHAKKGLRGLVPRWIQDPKRIPELWEGKSFELLIYLTLRLKLMQGGGNSGKNSGISSGNSSGSNGNPVANSGNPGSIPNDMVMLVLCEENEPKPQEQSKSLWRKPKPAAAIAAATTATTVEATQSQPLSPLSPQQRVVGMIELSLQPPDADRNPPALPLPRWFKAALARQTTIDGRLQGWITNLLVDDDRRGRGYSKLLVAACEGIAKHSWGCSSVYLHADADISSGRIPQSLYEGMGYEAVVGSTQKNPNGARSDGDGGEYAWAGVAGKELERFTAIRMVDGVALLCYSKKL